MDPAFADFNIHIYEKDGTLLSDVLHDADTFPMMGGSNLVLVYDFPFDKKADVEDIKAYLKDVPDTTVLDLPTSLCRWTPKGKALEQHY